MTKSILRHKPREKYFRVDPRRKKIQHCEKILFSGSRCFEKLKPNLVSLATFHTSLVCERVWKIAKPPKFGFTFSKQPPQKYFETISASESGPIDRKFWLQANTTLFSTFYHFDQPLPRRRPPCCTLCQNRAFYC